MAHPHNHHLIIFLVKRESYEFDVMASLKLFLQSGAKWDSFVWERAGCVFLRPYHIICQQTDDQHELLDMMFEADTRKAMNNIDSSSCTPLSYYINIGAMMDWNSSLVFIKYYLSDLQ